MLLCLILLITTCSASNRVSGVMERAAAPPNSHSHRQILWYLGDYSLPYVAENQAFIGTHADFVDGVLHLQLPFDDWTTVERFAASFPGMYEIQFCGDGNRAACYGHLGTSAAATEDPGGQLLAIYVFYGGLLLAGVWGGDPSKHFTCLGGRAEGRGGEGAR